MSDRLRLYQMREGFVEHLHKVDHRVQFNKGECRPYLGIVLEIGEHHYFVPLESPKPNHAQIKSGAHIMRLDGGELGILGFNNMIPAKQHYLIEFDINELTDIKYKRLLQKQIEFCNKHRLEIRNKAAKTYTNVKKGIPFFKKVCCDFEKLEQEYTKYYFKTTKQ